MEKYINTIFKDSMQPYYSTSTIAACFKNAIKNLHRMKIQLKLATYIKVVLTHEYMIGLSLSQFLSYAVKVLAQMVAK